MSPCRWCGCLFAPRRDGGKGQRFCRPDCRRAFDAAGRRWIAAALAGGQLTLPALKDGSTATRALSVEAEEAEAYLSRANRVLAAAAGDCEVSAPDALIASRRPTHGDFADTATIAQSLKAVFAAAGAGRFDAPQRDALDQIATQLARILVGDPANADHWRDLAGYAWLVVGANGA